MPVTTLQPDETASADTFITPRAATTNFSTSVILIVGELNDDTGTAGDRTLIKFDLSSIPSIAVVVSAVLSLYATEDHATNARTYRVYRQKRAWVEGQATWNIYSTGNNWQTAGGFGSNDCEQTDIGSRSFSASETLNAFKDFSLDAAKVQEWISGAFANNGLLIRADTESNDGYYFASASNTTAANRPKLVITYDLQPPSSAAVGATAAPTIAINTPVQGGSAQAIGASVSPTVVKGSIALTPSAAAAASEGTTDEAIRGSVALEGTASAVGETVRDDPLIGGSTSEPVPAEAVGETDGIAVKGSILVIPEPAESIGSLVSEVVKGSVIFSPLVSAIGLTLIGSILSGAPTLTPEPAGAMGVTAGPFVLIPATSTSLRDRAFKGMNRAKYKGMH